MLTKMVAWKRWDKCPKLREYYTEWKRADANQKTKPNDKPVYMYRYTVQNMNGEKNSKK